MGRSSYRNIRVICLALACVVALSSFPTATAHGEEEMGHMDVGADQSKPDPKSYPATYFSHPEHRVAIWTHIGLMTIAWVFMLPTGKTLARSPVTFDQRLMRPKP